MNSGNSVTGMLQSITGSNMLADKIKLNREERDMIRLAQESFENTLESVVPLLADEEMLFTLRKVLRAQGRENDFFRNL